MNILLWIVQVLLAAVFLAHGLFLLMPPASMLEMMNAAIPPAFRIFLGIAEVLAGIGVIVPGVTRIQPRLVPLAAAGLIPIMIGATIFHITRGETSSAVITAVLLALLTFVTYERWKVRPIAPRGRTVA